MRGAVEAAVEDLPLREDDRASSPVEGRRREAPLYMGYGGGGTLDGGEVWELRLGALVI